MKNVDCIRQYPCHREETRSVDVAISDFDTLNPVTQQVVCLIKTQKHTLIAPGLLTFDNFWNGKSSYLKVLDIPKAVQERMIDIAPKNLESVGMGFYPKQQKNKEKIKLFTYQEEAIDAWITKNVTLTI